MVKYVVKRLLLMIPVILCISLVIFTLMSLAPGDPAKMALGPRASEESMQAFRDEHGISNPFWVRFGSFIWNALHGDLGKSYRTGTPVVEEILNRLPTTIKVALGSMVIVVILGIPIGILSAVKQYSLMDNTTLVGALLLSSMPGFWLGTLLILLFALYLGWLPVTFVESFKGYLLPWFTLAAAQMATLVRNTRSNMLEVVRADYIKMARAKGASEIKVIVDHALRNALMPIVTIMGMNFIELLGGTVIIEHVFNIPGLSSLALTSVRRLDAPVVLGIVLVVAIIGGFLNLFVDIIYVYIDPRLKSMYIRKKVLKDTHQDTNQETGPDTVPEMIRDIGSDTAPETIQHTAPEMIQDTASEMIQDTIPEIMQDTEQAVDWEMDQGFTEQFPEPEADEEYKKRSQFTAICRRFVRNKTAMVGLVLMVIILLAVFSADLYLDYQNDAIYQNMVARLSGQSAGNWLGTDQYGRDMFARIIFGGRTSLLTALCVIAASTTFGCIIGSIAAYYGSLTDNIIMRIVDVLYAIPETLLAVCIVAAMGGGMVNLGIACILTVTPGSVRLFRSWVAPLKEQDFIEAARACGTSDWRILTRHILPNTLGPIIVQATLHLALTIIAVAGLSYIGLGVQSPTPEWGAMLSEAREYMRDYPHLVLIPGIAILLSTLSLNMVGDGLRDALDPKLRH